MERHSVSFSASSTYRPSNWPTLKDDVLKTSMVISGWKTSFQCSHRVRSHSSCSIVRQRINISSEFVWVRFEVWHLLVVTSWWNVARAHSGSIYTGCSSNSRPGERIGHSFVQNYGGVRQIRFDSYVLDNIFINRHMTKAESQAAWARRGRSNHLQRRSFFHGKRRCQ